MNQTVQNAAIILIVTLLLGVGMGAGFVKSIQLREGFSSSCRRCNNSPCACPGINMSKYVLKTTIPPCPSMPDLTNYMLKSECPPVPDLSRYVLKSSIPKPQPVIIDSSACSKQVGECPPCPRPRCPTVQCPAPTKCPPPAPCPRPVCPPTTVKCRAEEANAGTVRPYLAPLGISGFGMA